MSNISVRTAAVPEDCDYIKPGKIYHGEKFRGSRAFADIFVEGHRSIFITIEQCAHLNGAAWEVTDG